MDSDRKPDRDDVQVEMMMMPPRRLMCCCLLAMSLYAVFARGAAPDTVQDAVRDSESAAAALGPHAPGPRPAHEPGTAGGQAPRCLAQGDGYLQARISGSIQAELDWGNEGMQCTGAVRPAGKGIRIRFSRPGTAVGDAALDAHGAAEDATRKHDRERKAEAGSPAGVDAARGLVLVFGVTGLREGQSARALPVNLTVIREGRGQFYSTQGDDKCLLDDVTQTPIIGLPRRSRSYRIVARGFCTEPARAVRGPGAILLSRFDFAGQVDFETEDTDDELRVAMPDG
jgi:hypothetical protein